MLCHCHLVLHDRSDRTNKNVTRNQTPIGLKLLWLDDVGVADSQRHHLSPHLYAAREYRRGNPARADSTLRIVLQTNGRTRKLKEKDLLSCVG